MNGDPTPPSASPTNRWGNRTPSPDFIKRAVSPLSPCMADDYRGSWTPPGRPQPVQPPANQYGPTLRPPLFARTMSSASAGLELLANLCDDQPKMPVPMALSPGSILPAPATMMNNEYGWPRRSSHSEAVHSVAQRTPPAFGVRSSLDGLGSPVDPLPTGASPYGRTSSLPIGPSPSSSPTNLRASPARAPFGYIMPPPTFDSFGHMDQKRSKSEQHDLPRYGSELSYQADGKEHESAFLHGGDLQFGDDPTKVSRRRTHGDLEPPNFLSSRPRRYTSDSAPAGSMMVEGRPPFGAQGEYTSPSRLPTPASESTSERLKTIEPRFDHLERSVRGYPSTSQVDHSAALEPGVGYMYYGEPELVPQSTRALARDYQSARASDVPPPSKEFTMPRKSASTSGRASKRKEKAPETTDHSKARRQSRSDRSASYFLQPASYLEPDAFSPSGWGSGDLGLPQALALIPHLIPHPNRSASNRLVRDKPASISRGLMALASTVGDHRVGSRGKAKAFTNALGPNGDVTMGDASAPVAQAVTADAMVIDDSGEAQVSGQNEICRTCKVPYGQDDDVGAEDGMWIECDSCSNWHHTSCVGVAKTDIDKIDKFHCPACERTKGPSTFKRTSGRAHTAIDYNALHNGSSVPIKNPDNQKIHPYINIINTGSKPLAASHFRYVEPENVTADTLDGMVGGWNEPFIVPAASNAAPWREPQTPQSLEQAGVPTRSYMPPPVPPASSIHNKYQPPTPEEKEFPARLRRADADGLGMVIPPGLTVRRVAELIGLDRPVEMIDVLTQASSKDEKWHMAQLVDYFENPAREVIYNCISCEVSNTPLGEMISRPQVVRDTDLVDRVWREQPPHPVPPTVGKYVLMSVKDSFTDFHIDFAGSSVFYHIYEGEKVFLVIRPTSKTLKAYEEWCRSPNMNATWFPDLVDEPCTVIRLYKGDTMFIPSGWIHAVHTPVDSLVIGGNFLTRNHYENQHKVQLVEVATDVKISQRYPKYTTLMFHVVYRYLHQDPIPEAIEKRLENGELIKPRVKGYGFRDLKDSCLKVKSTRKYTKAELEGLPFLLSFVYRAAGIAGGWILKSNKPGEPKLTQKAIESVRKAIPEPFRANTFECVRLFARWCNYMRAIYNIVPGGEALPAWAQKDWVPPQMLDKKSDAYIKKQQKQEEEKKLEEARQEELSKNRPGLRERRPRPSHTPVPEARTADLFLEDSAPKRRGPSTIPQAQRKRKPPIDAPLPPIKKSKSPATPPAPKPKKAKGQKTLKIPANFFQKNTAQGSTITLSDGSVYLYKISNLGPARTGCENCRKKKTKCKHTEEIEQVLKSKGFYDGDKPIAKSKQQKVEDDILEGIPYGIQEHASPEEKTTQNPQDPDVEIDNSEDIRPERTPAQEGEVGIEEITEVATENVAEPPDTQKPDLITPSEPSPQASVDEPVTPQRIVARASSSADPKSAPPPGYKGRKPSCPECKSLKKKCPHEDTWGLLGQKNAARDAERAQRKSDRRHRKQSNRGITPVYASTAPENHADASSDMREEESVANEHEVDILDSIRLAGSTPRQVSTKSAQLAPSSPIEQRSASSKPAASSASPIRRRKSSSASRRQALASGDADVAVVSLNWDTTGLLGEAESSYDAGRDTPEDPAIMAPPVVPAIAGKKRRSSSPTGETSVSARPMKRSRTPAESPASPENAGTSSRKKSKGLSRTYTSQTKTIKRKSTDHGSPDESHRKAPKTAQGESSASAAGSGGSGEPLMSQEDMRRLALGLRGTVRLS